MSRSVRALLAVAAAAAMLGTAAGCGGPADAGGADDGRKRVAYSSTSISDQYRVTFVRLLNEAAAARNFEMLPLTDANNDPAKQITDVTTLLGQGVDGIFIVVLDSKAIKPALDRAEAAGVPVVAVDQGPTAGKVAITVRGDSVLEGRQGCEALGEAMGGKGKVLELQGDLAGAIGVQRSKGFNDCMAEEYPDITVVSRPTQWAQEKATTATQTVLSTDPDVNGIFLASDSAMLPGVIEVLSRLGRLVPAGQEGHVPIVSIDGSPFGLEQVRAGYVDAVMAARLGDYATLSAEYLERAMNGETFDLGPTDHNSTIVQDGENIADILVATPVTKANVDDPTLWGNQAKG
ncbi:monosaccharide ABC transporter substrate-binding protein, CUT2 family [Pseudonocardia thermophila]|jgi:ABC-type sugar transport system, periplasmic component|uniref:Monosaccharide ABC transporter substrate-binding protein, CUT2 family n=1 Tax=Pseudonocardia thermophila TaxID=1848 RepID=A0A1M6PMN8_PSETH|nr:sugar ABC transporter substrate-binding protein [Pseudonocardia thermophila]SHK09183.1 monosaccharide ABC transporter substrate-binding protein, CUT2 family [Pseudonocardia thermophila]